MVVALAATLVACTGGPAPREGVLDVSPASSLDDEPVRIQVTGLSAGQEIELTATATGLDGAAWSSSATFRANGEGVVDLDRDAPISGDYSGVDGMGLIAAMAPDSAPAPPPADPTGSPDPSAPPASDEPGLLPVDQWSDGYPITVALTDGPLVEIRRTVVAPGATVQELTVAEHGVAGLLATPAEAAGPGVLLIGGSEGGVSVATISMALMLAAHGYPALAVGYFGAPGLPGELRNIPIEYFADAATKLPGPVRVVGYSRGSEAALLLSALYPQLVAGIVLAAPADRINLGFPDGGYAWTVANTPRLDIPFSAIAGPVLAIAGSADAVWPAADNVEGLAEQLGERLQSIVIEGAGHDILGVPYRGSNPQILHPVTGSLIHMGGSRQTNEQARRETWAALLTFLTPTS